MKTSQREPEGDTAPALTFNIEAHHQESRRATVEQAGSDNTLFVPASPCVPEHKKGARRRLQIPAVL